MGGVCNVLESDGFEVVLVPTDPSGRVDLDRFAAEVRAPGHPPRERAAREPRARHDPADRRGGTPRARGEGPRSTRTPARRSGGSRSTSMPSASICCRSRATSSGAPRAWARCSCVAGSGSPPIHAVTNASGSAGPAWRTRPGSPAMAAALTTSTSHDGRRGGPPLGPDGSSPRGDRGRRPGRDGPRPPDPSHPAPRLLQRSRAGPGHPRDGVGRSWVPSGRWFPVQRAAGGPVTRARAARSARACPASAIGLGSTTTADDVEAFAGRASRLGRRSCSGSRAMRQTPWMARPARGRSPDPSR